MYSSQTKFACCSQTVFEQAFALGLASQAALVTGTIERMGPCSNSTFIAAQYSLALGSTMTTNQTAAGLALAAAMNADLAGCAVAAASGLPLLEAGCSLTTLEVLASKPHTRLCCLGVVKAARQQFRAACFTLLAPLHKAQQW